MKQPIDENRLYWIDAIRSFACLCVLTIHAYVPGGTHGARIVGGINYFAVAGASILFFMISGALVLYKPKKFFPFMKQRLLRIALPMIIWTIITLVIGCFTGAMNWHDLPNAIVLIPFAPQYGTYWFIYVVFGIYFVTPILSPNSAADQPANFRINDKFFCSLLISDLVKLSIINHLMLYNSIIDLLCQDTLLSLLIYLMINLYQCHLQ